MAKQLTEQQQRFLEVLFLPEVGGSFVKAKKLAGYSDNMPTSQVVRSLKDEILEATRDYLVANGPKAATAITSAMDDPTQLGIQFKMNAAKDVLDRIGVVKTEKVEVTSNSLFILPAKQEG